MVDCWQDLAGKFLPGITPVEILKLEILDGEGLIWVIVAILNYIWNQRKTKREAFLEECKNHLMFDLEALSQTKHRNLASIATILISM